MTVGFSKVSVKVEVVLVGVVLLYAQPFTSGLRLKSVMTAAVTSPVDSRLRGNDGPGVIYMDRYGWVRPALWILP